LWIADCGIFEKRFNKINLFNLKNPNSNAFLVCFGANLDERKVHIQIILDFGLQISEVIENQ
jgi:hypothetical protein